MVQQKTNLTVTEAASPVIPSIVTETTSPIVPLIVTEAATPVVPSIVTETASPVIPSIVTEAATLCNLWQHINSVNISRRLFPCVEAFESGNRLVCSEPSCRWASHSRFTNSGFRRLVRAGYSVVLPLLSSEIPEFSNYIFPPSTSPSFAESVLSIDPLEIGLLSASACKYLGPPAMESEVLNVLLNHVMICSVTTVSHIPRSVRPLLAHVLSIEFQKACTSV